MDQRVDLGEGGSESEPGRGWTWERVDQRVNLGEGGSESGPGRGWIREWTLERVDQRVDLGEGGSESGPGRDVSLLLMFLWIQVCGMGAEKHKALKRRAALEVSFGSHLY